MPPFDWTINLPSLVGWALAGGVGLWRLGRFEERFEQLARRQLEHEAEDEKRFDATVAAVNQFRESLADSRADRAGLREKLVHVDRHLESTDRTVSELSRAVSQR